MIPWTLSRLLREVRGECAEGCEGQNAACFYGCVVDGWDAIFECIDWAADDLLAEKAGGGGEREEGEEEGWEMHGCGLALWLKVNCGMERQRWYIEAK